VKPVTRLCLVALLTLGASGCVFIDGGHVSHDDWRETQRDNRKMISELTIGMDHGAVLARLGTPADSEAFSHSGGEVRVLFYRTQRKHADGETSRDETTPLVFENDILIGWGDAVYADLRY
jgi:hypothetical protein